MFSVFGKKKINPSVNHTDKDWIENNIKWFIEMFGFEKVKNMPFFSPTFDVFPYDNLSENSQFQKLFNQLCDIWEVDATNIEVCIFDDVVSMQWNSWFPFEKVSEPAGTFERGEFTDKKSFRINIAKSNFEHPQKLVFVMAHELAHVKLLGNQYLHDQQVDLEPLTDLACIYFGFGVIMANSLRVKDFKGLSKTGYLPDQIVSYSNAIICYITKTSQETYLNEMNDNIKDLFKNDFQFLSQTQDTLLNEKVIYEANIYFECNQTINAGYDENDYHKVVDGSEKLLKLQPKNAYANSNIAFVHQEQSKFEDAIEYYTKAIESDPFWIYPYWNRGYCKLQLGDFENAYWDLYHAHQMDPSNNYCWRNLGLYYLAKNELDNALVHFEEALKLDENTVNIHQYLSEVHSKLGNVDMAEHHSKESKSSENKEM
jgi:tetratricopeptide (TPR) repeat protein